MFNNFVATLALLPAISMASESADKLMQKAVASAECSAYLTVVYENTHKAEDIKIKKHAEKYLSSMKSVLASPNGKQHIKDGLYAQSGVDFDDDFYAGVIFSGTITDIKESIKNAIPLDISASLPFEELKTRWADEAERRYNSSNCDLLE
jgi:hypothetical protein